MSHMKKTKWLLIALLFPLFSSGCMDPAGVVARANGDYFPISLSSWWKYVSSDSTDTVLMEVTDYSEAGNDTIYVVDFVGDVWELFVQNGNILKHYRYEIYPSGDEVVLEDRFGTFFEIPFVDGNTWTYRYADTVSFRGVDYSFQHEVTGTCRLIGNYSVPYGEFEDVYQVVVTDSIFVNGAGDGSLTEFYFADGVGPIALKYDGVLYGLVDYGVEEEP